MILTFTGPGCVPCKMMKERFKETNDLHGVPIYMVSMEDAPNLANEYLVMGVPTTVHLREGSEVSRAVGMRNQEQLAIEFNLR